NQVQAWGCPEGGVVVVEVLVVGVEVTAPDRDLRARQPAPRDLREHVSVVLDRLQIGDRQRSNVDGVRGKLDGRELDGCSPDAPSAIERIWEIDRGGRSDRELAENGVPVLPAQGAAASGVVPLQ